MAFLKCIAGLLFGLCIGSLRGDDSSTLYQSKQELDAAINIASEAWVQGSAQTQLFKTVIANSDATQPATIEAQAVSATYENQLASYDTALDNLLAQRLSFNHDEVAVLIGQRINAYKTMYVSHIGVMTAQLKIVEDSLATIQGLVADTTLTDTKIVAVSDARGKALGAVTGVDDVLSALGGIDGKIEADMPTLNQQAAAQATEFLTWWDTQKAWIAQTRTAVAARRQYLTQLDGQMAQKKKDYDAAVALQKKLSEADADLQAKKAEAMELFKGLVEVRATLIQQMADLANVIALSLGSADTALTSTADSVVLDSVLAAAQEVTNNMIDMGGLQRAFGSSEDVIAQALEGLKAYFSDQELVSLRGSITQQAAWMQGFGSALQAIRDQSAAIRTRLNSKREQLAAATSTTAVPQSASEYAASVNQLTQIIAQVHNEAASLINEVMTPLVLSVSQKILLLTNTLDVKSSTSSDLIGMKNLIDKVVDDSAEIEASLKEFNLWSNTLSQYGGLIEQQVSDVSLKETLAAIQKDFVDWNIWVSAVTKRQQAITATLSVAQTKYTDLSTRATSATDVAYAFDLSSKQLAVLLSGAETKLADISAVYQAASTALAAFNDLKGSDALLAQITGLMTALSSGESDTAKVQELWADALKTFNDLASSSLKDTYAAEVRSLQGRVDALAQKMQKIRSDVQALRDQALAKKMTLGGDVSTSLSLTVTSSASVADSSLDVTLTSSLDAEAAVPTLSLVTTPTVEPLDVTSTPSLTPATSLRDAAVLSTALTSSVQAPDLSTTMTPSANVVSTVLLGEPAVRLLGENVKKVVSSVAALNVMAATFKKRLDDVKTQEDFAPVSKDFIAARGQAVPLSTMLGQLVVSADAAQKALDQDAAAGRNLSKEVVELLAAQRTLIGSTQKDLQVIVAGLNDHTSQFNGLSDGFAKREADLLIVVSAIRDVSVKIQSISNNLDAIKASISSAQAVLVNGAMTGEFDNALGRLAEAERLRTTISNAKANDVGPAYALLKSRVAEYVKVHGALAADTSSSIANQGTWLGALDVSLGGFMDTIVSLKSQLTVKRGLLMQNDVKTLSATSFSQQLKALEEAVPAVTQPAHVETLMRKLDYAVSNRYGTLPEDKSPNMIASNKSRLVRFIDWIVKNKRFSAKTGVLAAYRKQIAG